VSFLAEGQECREIGTELSVARRHSTASDFHPLNDWRPSSPRDSNLTRERSHPRDARFKCSRAFLHAFERSACFKNAIARFVRVICHGTLGSLRSPPTTGTSENDFVADTLLRSARACAVTDSTGWLLIRARVDQQRSRD